MATSSYGKAVFVVPYLFSADDQEFLLKTAARQLSTAASCVDDQRGEEARKNYLAVVQTLSKISATLLERLSQPNRAILDAIRKMPPEALSGLIGPKMIDVCSLLSQAAEIFPDEARQTLQHLGVSILQEY